MKLAEQLAEGSLRAMIKWLGERGWRICRWDRDHWAQIDDDSIARALRKDRA